MKDNKNDYLVTPLDVSGFAPIYDARGRVTGYRVTVEYYMGKLFAYASNDKYNAMCKHDSVNWVLNMQRSGYNLLCSPIYKDTHSMRSVYILCERSYDFPRRTKLGFRSRAWKFWLKMQSECNKISQEAKNSIYENIK